MKGLTLIEVLVAMGIASLVGVLLLVIIVNSAGLFTQQSSKVQAGLNSNDALVKIRSTIKDASTVAVSYTSGQTTYTTGSTQLVLKVPSIDTSNNIIANTYDFLIFYLDQKILRFKTFPDAQSSKSASDQIFSTDVENLDFKYFNSATPPEEVTPGVATKVKVSLTLRQNTATTEANLRND